MILFKPGGERNPVEAVEEKWVVEAKGRFPRGCRSRLEDLIHWMLNNEMGGVVQFIYDVFLCVAGPGAFFVQPRTCLSMLGIAASFFPHHHVGQHC